MTALATLWRQNRLLVLSFAAALALTAFFAVRFALGWLHWQDPATRDQPIAGWMTPRYVAMSWHVPRDVMLDALGMTPGARPMGKPQSIAAIARARGMTEAQLIAEIEAAIATFRATGGSGGQ